MKAGSRQLHDVYAYLEKVSSLTDTEFRIVAPINIRLESGGKMIVCLMIELHFLDQPEERLWHNSADWMWPPRPIFTRDGTIIFHFEQNTRSGLSKRSIHSCSGSDFCVQRMAVITSICNTRKWTSKYLTRNHVSRTTMRKHP